jgi:hypothetical protein
MNKDDSYIKTLHKPFRLIISWIITGLLLAGVVFSLFNIKFILITGLILVLSAFLFGCIYALLIKGLSKVERLVIFLMSFIQLIGFVFRIQHWKGAGIANMALIVPIGLFIYITFKMEGKLKHEFPFLSVMAFLALLTFFGI